MRTHACSGGGSCPALCIPGNEPPGDGPVACAVDYCKYSVTGCPDGDWTTNNLCCHFGISPIVVDLMGDGFSLTDAAHGVDFDF